MIVVYAQRVQYRHLIHMIYFRDYLKSVRARGRLYFTSQEALAELHISSDALRSGIYKLRKKGEVASPAKGLYIIVPPEYQNIGCLPPEELTPILMKYWKLDYYVSLLTAALYHGASHQKPQVFQIIASKQLKPLLCGKVKIEFIYKKSFVNIPIQDKVVKSGYLKIATPETTAMDLLMYVHRSGGLNHVAIVLSELLESIKVNELSTLISSSNQKAWIQRLGYILEKIDPLEIKKRNQLVHLLKTYLAQEDINFVALNPDLPIKGMSRNHDWKIIENAIIESDE